MGPALLVSGLYPACGHVNHAKAGSPQPGRDSVQYQLSRLEAGYLILIDPNLMPAFSGPLALEYIGCEL
jgi:hypothetical protein